MENYCKYYNKKLIARSGNSVFEFDEFYNLLQNNENTLSHMQPLFHQILPKAADQLVAWFTTIHFYTTGEEAYRINTMSNYKIKDNKVVEIEFMWDKPIEYKNLRDRGHPQGVPLQRQSDLPSTGPRSLFFPLNLPLRLRY